jgi:hypothetical protein
VLFFNPDITRDTLQFKFDFVRSEHSLELPRPLTGPSGESYSGPSASGPGYVPGSGPGVPAYGPGPSGLYFIIYLRPAGFARVQF